MAHKPEYAVGVDAGSTRTRCVICVVEDGELRFLGAGSAPSQGWQRGRAADTAKISESIKAAVKEAESRARVLVRNAVLGIGGPEVEAMQGRGVYEFSVPKEVTAEDLSFAVGLAARVRMEEERRLIHVLPQDFTVDGRAGFRYPVGAVCSRIEANVLLVTALEVEHDSVVSAAQQAHLHVEDTVFEPVASAYACVFPSERSRGVAVVDLGVDSTSLVIYDGDAALTAVSLPITSDHLTRDLAAGLRYTSGITVTLEDAETLKREYGCAMRGLTNDSTLIEVPLADGRGWVEISRMQINEILEARAEEIFLYVREEAARVGMDQSLLEGVVLTGGGARLSGLCDMAEKVLSSPAKFGLAAGIRNWPQNFQDPAWSVAAGLAMYSARLSLRKNNRRRPPGFFGLFGWQ
ncbi:MAG: cell division protein FtsA [Acidimicrobiia bacterium]|nr:cell division protein FtsA [Acidimicrobiia bacterium]